MDASETTWELAPHTRGKHEVLRQYLTRWFPIIASFAPKFAFIDGFAGPGEYRRGEPGSPIIALETFRKLAPKISGKATFLFVEQDPRKAEHLESVIARQTWPSNCRHTVAIADFEQKMTALLDRIGPGKQLSPAFMMLDPFGVSGIPMTLIERVLKSRKSELYITLMYEFIRRFISTPEFEGPLDRLFGTDEWRKALALKGTERREFLFGLYRDQLTRAGAEHVLRFDLYQKGQIVYAIFFVTRHWKGADVMKKAIWKVAPFGDFAFHSADDGQLTFGAATLDYSPLQRALQTRFRGEGFVTIEEIEAFVATGTDFHTGHVRQGALIPLEKAARIQIQSPRKKARSYPSGTTIRFL